MKKKKVIKKYQPGGFTGSDYNPFMGDNLNQGNTSIPSMGQLPDPFNGAQPFSRHMVNNTQEQVVNKHNGWNLDSDGEYRKNEITEDKSKLGYRPGVQLLNGLMDFTRNTANTLNGIRDGRQERQDYMNARYEDPRYNINEGGINNVPVYMKYGGESKIFAFGGKPKTREDYETQMNNGYDAYTPKVRGREFYNQYDERNVVPLRPKSFEELYGSFDNIGDGKLKVPPAPILAPEEYSVDVTGLSSGAFGEPMNRGNTYKKTFSTREEKNEYLSRGDNKLSNIRNPRFNRDYTGLVGERDWFSSQDSKDAWWEKARNRKGYATGGAPGGEQEQIMQMLEMYAQMSNIKIEDLMSQIQGLPEQEQQAALQQIQQEIMQAQQGQPKQGGSKLEQGGIPEVEGSYEGDIELERGEVFEDQEGAIQKVAETEPLHEDGGSMQPTAARVLEDTADKRDNLDSKLLKVKPTEVESMFGFKPKGSVSHSKLFELTTDFFGKKIKKLQNKIEENLDYVKRTNSPYAQNSLDENLKLLEELPTENELFEIVYQHQENIKEIKGVGSEQDNNKFATGGPPPPPYGWKDEKSKKQGLTEYHNSVKKLGYTGAADIDAIQKFMVDKYPDLVKDYMTNRGIENTNKGIKLKKEGKYTPEGAFNDALWWYRSMLPENKTFKTQAELDAFIKDKDVVKNGDINYYTDPKDLGFQRNYYNPSVLGDTPGVAPEPNKMDKITNELDLTLPTPKVTDDPKDPIKLEGDINKDGVQASKFDEPLRWFDIAGAVNKYVDTKREPVHLEQLSRQPLNVRELNALPTLLQNQGDMNAMIEQLPTNGVGFANQANLMANKYKANNEVLGNTENVNKQKRDQMDQYNDQNQFAVDQANLTLRDQFKTRILQGKEVQRQQKFAALDGMFTKLAQNRKLNRDGNLMLQMTPYFDQMGKYNGNNLDITGTMSSLDKEFKAKGIEGITTDYTENSDGTTQVNVKDASGKMIKSMKLPNKK